jgi:hypothetical protein
VHKKGRESSLFIDHIGEKFISVEGYTIEVIEYFKYRNCTIRFDDGTIIKNVEYYNAKTGNICNPYHPSVCNVGYFGIGKYKSFIDGVKTLHYSVWHSMMLRCYNSNTKKRTLTYKDVVICEEWKNFQNFAEWLEKTYNYEYMKGWELDKDIICKECKIYSPETCCFVPKEINQLLVKRNKSRGIFPIGVTFNKINNNFTSKINKNGKTFYIGSFKSPEEAFQAYKIEKEKYIKEIANKWKDKIDPRVYETLCNYQVQITD